MSDKLSGVLSERKKTHGDFKGQFECAQLIKNVLKDYGYKNIPIIPREALDQICHKISRIVTGDPVFADHWRDIGGYATLIADMLDENKVKIQGTAILGTEAFIADRKVRRNGTG